MSITKYKALLGVTILWLIFTVLAALCFNYFELLNICGFSALIFCPGMLFCIALRLQGRNTWELLGYTISFSLLILMVGVLVSNVTLPLLGVVRPLDPLPLYYTLNTIMVALLAIAAWRGDSLLKLRIQHNVGFSRLDLSMLILPLLFVALSVLGATSLNNGGTNLFTLVMLGGAAAYAVLLVTFRNRLNTNIFPVAIFLLSLSFLFMNSLRGWYTTGHDIQREFHVFQLAKDNGIWEISKFRDAYNACLSITILPTIFANLLKMPDPYIYKVPFQVIFAYVPTMIYLLMRRFSTRLVALLSCFYFISFPTFFTDMSFLNRQEIAFFFFIMMLYLLFQEDLALRKRQVIFLLLGGGLILSHYSTTDSVIAILIFALSMRPLLLWFGRRYSASKYFTQSSLELFRPTSEKTPQRLTVWMLLALICGSLLWTTVLTDTGNTTVQVVQQTLVAVGNTFKADAPRANDTNYNLFSFTAASPQQQLKDYIHQVVDIARAKDPSDYYPASTYNHDRIRIAPTEILPLTKLGRTLASFGLSIPTFNSIMRQGSAKLLQILMLIGIIYVFLRSKYLRQLETEYLTLAAGCIIFVFLQVVLPVLSVEYGLLRAFQQSLMLVGVLIVLGSTAIAEKIPGQRAVIWFPTALAVGFMLSSTGFVTQLLGGYGAQLNLNNTGIYYDVYYLHKTEVLGIDWLSSHVKAQEANGNVQAEVETDKYVSARVTSLSDVSTINDIYPGFIRKNSYVFLGYTNTTKHQATFTYNGDLITYDYPIEFLNQNKDLIYNDGGSRVYR